MRSLYRMVGLLLMATLMSCGKTETPRPEQTGSTTSSAAATPTAEPPPDAPRRNAVETVSADHAVIRVSDIDLALGASDVASVELRPTGDWKLNTEYPIRVSIDGLTVAETARREFLSGKLEHGMRVTAGGFRLDVPMTGQAAGEERVTATIKYGVCTDATCITREARAGWRVAVQ